LKKELSQQFWTENGFAGSACVGFTDLFLKFVFLLEILSGIQRSLLVL
jgi:hypothetical protein